MNNIFDNIVELPNKGIQERTKNLVGFDSKFDRIFSNLKLLLDQEGLSEWSKKFHKVELPIISQLQEKYPLIILSGDAGTGKTISAEAIADRMLRELKKDGFFPFPLHCQLYLFKRKYMSRLNKGHGRYSL